MAATAEKQYFDNIYYVHKKSCIFSPGAPKNLTDFDLYTPDITFLTPNIRNDTGHSTYTGHDFDQLNDQYEFGPKIFTEL